MEIEIDNRVCIIVGPTTSGKTTLSKRIQKEFDGKCVVISHDQVLSTIPKNQSQDQINFQFRTALARTIQEAIADKNNELIVLDTINIHKRSFISFVLSFPILMNYLGEITILKMNVDPKIRKSFLIKRMANPKTRKEVDTNCFIEHPYIFNSMEGSLHTTLPDTDEYIITDPLSIQLSFDGLLPHKKYTK